VLVERCAYDAFGRPTIRDANSTEIAESALANPYLFTGRAWDPETALYYYRARYYDYFTGRFLQPDPTGYADGLNLYSYCGNNPSNFLDPSGLFKEFASGFGWRALKTGLIMLGVIAVVGGAMAVCPPGAAAIVGAVMAKVAPFIVVAGGFAGGEMLGQVITGEDMRGNPLTMRERGEHFSDATFLIGGSFYSAAKIQAQSSARASGSRGSTANPARGSTLPRNLREQLAVQEAAANPGAGRPLEVPMTDSRWHATEGWRKMQQIIRPGGERINVHYVFNPGIGADDFKIIMSQ